MSKLSLVQQKLLDIIKVSSESYTLEELSALLDLSNRSAAHYHLKELVKKGFLKIDHSNPTGYLVLDQQDTGVCYLPLYSGAKCGPNGNLIPDYESDRIPVPSLLLRFKVSADNVLAIRSVGDSMEPDIPQGSIVIINKIENFIQKGSAYLVVNEGMPYIKLLSQAGDNIILSSINKKYDPFIASRDDNQFTIVGRVKAVINSEFSLMSPP